MITPDVEELRDHYGFPGMGVLQVGFENIEIGNIHLPEYHVENSVVYTGTHDNNTTLGWYNHLPDFKQRAIVEALGAYIEQPAWDFIRVAMSSVARTVVVPMQDVLQLDQSAQMTLPVPSRGTGPGDSPKTTTATLCLIAGRRDGRVSTCVAGCGVPTVTTKSQLQYRFSGVSQGLRSP